MSILIGILVVVFIAGILFLKGSHHTNKVKSRPNFLKELTERVEGRLENIPENPEGFRLRFRFENREFVFEDVYTVGFTTNKLNKAYLKIQLNSILSMTFSERKAKSTMRSDILMASKIPNEKITPKDVTVPASLREFVVHTNNITQANALLADPKIERIFADFKNSDSRGYPMMALRMIDGELMLEYQPSGHFKPSLLMLNERPELIEDHAAKLLGVAKRVEQVVL